MLEGDVLDFSTNIVLRLKLRLRHVFSNVNLVKFTSWFLSKISLLILKWCNLYLNFSSLPEDVTKQSRKTFKA